MERLISESKFKFKSKPKPKPKPKFTAKSRADKPMKASLHYGAVAVLVLLLSATWGQAGYYLIKAHLAQYLIAQAWEQQLINGEAVTPWSWADTYPVATLTIGNRDPLYVLAGANNRNLAFGPVLLNSDVTAPNLAIAAHNDTHFAVLEDINVGDAIQVETIDASLVYQVDQIRIIDQHDVSILSQYTPKQVTLITCYPFGTGAAATDLRYVMQASAVQASTVQ